MPRRPHLDGRHEGGQNLLYDRQWIARVTAEVAGWPPGPLTELAAGSGNLTVSLAAGGRSVTAVELDPRLATILARRTGPNVTVHRDDLLRRPLPAEGGVVSNLPFHLTTPLLRRLLAAPGWERALLLLQWEVARKRAAVGGTTLLTASWWPWFDFTLKGRVPARAFRPAPSVDGGLLLIERRRDALVAPGERAAYRRFVTAAFSGTPAGLLGTARGPLTRRAAIRRLRAAAVDPHSRPRDLDRAAWLRAYRALSAATPSASVRADRG